MSRKLRFDKDVNAFNMSIDPNYFAEVAQILWSRRGHTQLDVYNLFASMGQSLNDMISMLDNPDNLKLLEKIDHLADLNKEFLVHFALLIKFLMPMMEQLDASIDKHISVSDD